MIGILSWNAQIRIEKQYSLYKGRKNNFITLNYVSKVIKGSIDLENEENSTVMIIFIIS